MVSKFTQLTVSLPYPASIRGKLSSLHSSVIMYVEANFTGSYKEKRKIVQVLNTISYLVVTGDSFPSTWDENHPLDGLDIIDEDTCKDKLKDLFIVEKNVSWDIEVTSESTSEEVPQETNTAPTESRPTPASLKAQDKAERQAKVVAASQNKSSIITPTPKEDLYIRPPAVPQFDKKRIFASGVIDGTSFCVYHSLPEVPSKQNEISATTDVDKITSQHLRGLFPNRRINTRAGCMYSPVEGLDYHPILGVVIPVKGFTKKQLLENLVKYPHIFQLKKVVVDEIVSFYKTIEIDGELKDVFDIWDTLPDTSKLPRNADFIKEYVVRRYLLERDIKGVNHSHPMFGTLDPFLTLFTTIEEYIDLGYSQPEELARQCVASRVSYKQSRNPVLRRLSGDA